MKLNESLIPTLSGPTITCSGEVILHANAPSGSVYRAIKDVFHPQSLVQAVHAPLTEVARALVQALQADPKIQGNTCETQVSSWWENLQLDLMYVCRLLSTFGSGVTWVVIVASNFLWCVTAN